MPWARQGEGVEMHSLCTRSHAPTLSPLSPLGPSPPQVASRTVLVPLVLGPGDTCSTTSPAAQQLGAAVAAQAGVSVDQVQLACVNAATQAQRRRLRAHRRALTVRVPWPPAVSPDSPTAASLCCVPPAPDVRPAHHRYSLLPAPLTLT